MLQELLVKEFVKMRGEGTAHSPSLAELVPDMDKAMNWTQRQRFPQAEMSRTVLPTSWLQLVAKDLPRGRLQSQPEVLLLGRKEKTNQGSRTVGRIVLQCWSTSVRLQLELPVDRAGSTIQGVVESNFVLAKDKAGLCWSEGATRGKAP